MENIHRMTEDRTMDCKILLACMTASLFSVCTNATVKMANAQPQSSPSTLITHPKMEWYILSTAEKQRVRKGVLGWLKHPETARIRQIAAVKNRGIVTVCGYLTAQNFSDKYKGSVPFIGTLFSRGFVMTGVAIGDQTEVVTRTCNQNVFQ